MVVACSLSSCGGSGSDAGLGSPISKPAKLSIIPNSIDFGDVPVGTQIAGTATLTNSGTASVTVSQANVTGSGFSTSRLSLPLTLTAGQAGTFNVTFAPSTTGSATGSLSVVSNATNSPATVSLSGTGVSLLLAASPAGLSFGNVTVGSSNSQTGT